MSINYNPKWDNEYNADILPFNPWILKGSNMASITNNQLILNDNNTNAACYWEINDILKDNIITLEILIKIISDNSIISQGIQIWDGEKGIEITFQKNKLNIVNPINITLIDSFDIDLFTNFNDIKLIKYGQEKYEVYVNNELLFSRTDFLNYNVNRLDFGAFSMPNTGQSQWKLVRYCLNGIPMPLRYLIKQQDKYFAIKDGSPIELGIPTDNNQLEQWFNNNGIDDINDLCTKYNIESFVSSSKALGDGKLFTFDIPSNIKNINNVD